jgi:hypothetical protein
MSQVKSQQDQVECVRECVAELSPQEREVLARIDRQAQSSHTNNLWQRLRSTSVILPIML